jgi:hypothetical protein
MGKAYLIIRQDWTESERGWGLRPDGYSLHLTRADRDKFIEQYWEREKAYNEEHGVEGVPDEYSRPEGDCFEFPVDRTTLNKVREGKYGFRGREPLEPYERKPVTIA